MGGRRPRGCELERERLQQESFTPELTPKLAVELCVFVLTAAAILRRLTPQDAFCLENSPPRSPLGGVLACPRITVSAPRYLKIMSSPFLISAPSEV